MGPPPPKGCEVFVGNVPRDVFEDEVVPIFETAGKIYELRMMLDFSGTNRGYFFVRYSSRYFQAFGFTLWLGLVWNTFVF